jgi:hypothetical protein
LDQKPRTRRVIGEITPGLDGSVTFRYLDDTEDYREAEAAGFVGFPAFDPHTTVTKHGVLDALLRRLPPRNRDDFGRFLTQHRLVEPFQHSDIALLGYTGAQLPGDGFSIVPVFPDDVDECEFITEIAGVRHVAGTNIADISLGDKLSLSRDPVNPIDPADALHVLHNGRPIGYINRAMRSSFITWMKTHDIDITVDRLNGKPDRPLIYALVRLTHRTVHPALA